MFFIVYKTINKVNGKFYVGIHSTENIDDGYLGSGKNLKIAISKYGRENFERVILKKCSSREEMIEEERKIVTFDFIRRRDTYNSELGGSGGKEWTPKLRETMSKVQKKRFSDGAVVWNKGKKTGTFLTEDQRKELSNRMSGAGNHMFGKSAAENMTQEEYEKWCANVSKGNRKPKTTTEGYKTYASKRRWIVNKEGLLRHCLDLQDPRLLSGKWQLGKIWRELEEASGGDRQAPHETRQRS